MYLYVSIAIIWYLAEVAPLLASADPNMKLTIVGCCWEQFVKDKDRSAVVKKYLIFSGFLTVEVCVVGTKGDNLYALCWCGSVYHRKW